jgi:hypothetical protein
VKKVKEQHHHEVFRALKGSLASNDAEFVAFCCISFWQHPHYLSDPWHSFCHGVFPTLSSLYLYYTPFLLPCQYYVSAYGAAPQRTPPDAQRLFDHGSRRMRGCRGTPG